MPPNKETQAWNFQRYSRPNKKNPLKFAGKTILQSYWFAVTGKLRSNRKASDKGKPRAPGQRKRQKWRKPTANQKTKIDQEVLFEPWAFIACGLFLHLTFMEDSSSFLVFFDPVFSPDFIQVVCFLDNELSNHLFYSLLIQTLLIFLTSKFYVNFLTKPLSQCFSSTNEWRNLFSKNFAFKGFSYSAVTLSKFCLGGCVE